MSYMQEPCVDCLLDASPSSCGVCGKHARKALEKLVSATATLDGTFTISIEPTREDYEREIIETANFLVNLKWYEFSEKRYAKYKLKSLLKEYNSLDDEV